MTCVPSEDNPLAEGLDDGESADDLLDGGKDAEETDETDGRRGDDEDSTTPRTNGVSDRRRRSGPLASGDRG